MFGFMLVVVCSISNEKAAKVVQRGVRGAVSRSESITAVPLKKPVSAVLVKLKKGVALLRSLRAAQRRLLFFQVLCHVPRTGRRLNKSATFVQYFNRRVQYRYPVPVPVPVQL